MKQEYDFSRSVRNPYAKKLKKQISIRLDLETIEYFKKLSGETGIAYQKLINLYLTNCAVNKVRPEIVWKS